MHEHDFLKKHRIIGSDDFGQAWRDDFDRLDTYEQQAGVAGLQEPYAERAARLFSGDTPLAGDWPHLAGFWSRIENGDPKVSEELQPPMTLDVATDAPIGLATLPVEGALLVDGRAADESGAIGYALVRVESADPRYARP